MPRAEVSKQAVRGALAATFCLIALRLSSSTAAAAVIPPGQPVLPPVDPCVGVITLNCVPAPGQPGPGGQQFRPASPPSAPAPSPDPSPGPGRGPAPPPGVGQIPTDFGIHAMTQWVYNGGSWLGPQIYPLLTAPMGPTDWFGPLYQHMVNIGFLLLLLFTVLGLGCAILRKDIWLLVKVPCWYGPVSMFVTVLAITFTQLLSAITDGFTVYMMQAGFGDHLAALLTRAAAVLAAGGAGLAFLGPESFIVFLAGMAIVGGFLLALLELIARQVAIYACLLFIPVTVVTLVWPPVARIAKLMVEVLIGLLVLKWIVAAVLALGAAMLSANPISMGPEGDPGFATIVMGAVVMLTAVVGGPVFLAKTIPFVEHQAVTHWSSQPRRAASSVGLTNTRAMHGAMLERFGSKDTRERLAAARRTSLILPEGSTVFVRSPKPLPSGGRRTQ